MECCHVHSKSFHIKDIYVRFVFSFFFVLHTILLNSFFTPFLNENIEKCNELNKSCVGDKTIILTNKSSLIKSQKRLPNYIKRLRLFKTSNDIEYLRKFVHKVTIIDSLNIEIKLSLNPIDSLNLFIGSGTVNYKIGNLFKDVSYTIFF